MHIGSLEALLLPGRAAGLRSMYMPFGVRLLYTIAL